MPRHALAQAVQGRYEEIFEMVQAELRRAGLEPQVRAGMVLTGGAVRMEGVVELAEEMLQMPVRIGIPQKVAGLGEVVGNPEHATGVGLLLLGTMADTPRRTRSILPVGNGAGGLGPCGRYAGAAGFRSQALALPCDRAPHRAELSGVVAPQGSGRDEILMPAPVTPFSLHSRKPLR